MSSTDQFAFLRRVRAAQGYVDLGMPHEALREVDKAPADCQERLEIVLVRMEILRQLERWAEGAKLGQTALSHHADCAELYLIAAYAVRRHEGLEQAKAVLLSGEAILAKEAMFHFNIACYECQLGCLEAAKKRLERAFALDDKYRKVGREDPDLEPLWGWIA
jgi:tetratricopeptide (TPR) repeat protein